MLFQTFSQIKQVSCGVLQSIRRGLSFQIWNNRRQCDMFFFLNRLFWNTTTKVFRAFFSCIFFTLKWFQWSRRSGIRDCVQVWADCEQVRSKTERQKCWTKLSKETGAWCLISAYRFQRRPTWPSSKQLTDLCFSSNKREDKTNKYFQNGGGSYHFAIRHLLINLKKRKTNKKKINEENTHQNNWPLSLFVVLEQEEEEY